jgi:phytoene synthase
MEQRLKLAMDYCKEVTRRYSRSFYFSSGLLPHDKREAVRVLYAFARLSDNIVDGNEHLSLREKMALLDSWERAMEGPLQEQKHPVLLAWAEIRHRYEIPIRYSNDLLAGMRVDLQRNRYQTFAQLWDYCYRVASTVGLCSMYIVGFDPRPETFQRAEELGVALQLTNILRDVGEDWERGRLYLPQDDLDRFGYTEEDLARSIVDDRYRALMDFEIRRTNALYERGCEGLKLLDKDGRLAIASAAEVYRAILNKLVSWDYDNFHRRAYLSTWEKIRLMPRVWWRVRSLERYAATQPPTEAS